MITLINDHHRGAGSGAGAAGSIRVFFTVLDKKNDIIYKLLHSSYQCRMFLVDNFYNKANLPSDKATNAYYFIHSNEVSIDNILKNLSLLHAFERKAGIFLTKLIKYDKSGIIVEGDIEWHNTLWKVSLYSFLLKTLAYLGGIPTGDFNQETVYYKEFKKNEELFCKNMKNNQELTDRNYDFYTKAGIMWSSHSTPGFYSICSGENPPQRKVMEDFIKGVEE